MNSLGIFLAQNNCLVIGFLMDTEGPICACGSCLKSRAGQLRAKIRETSLLYGFGTPYRLAFFNGPNKKIDDVLLEYVGLPHVLPLTVHLDLEPLPNTQR